MSETSTLIGYAGRTIHRDELALVPTPPATATTLENSTLISYNGKITREELAQVPTPPATETHQTIAVSRPSFGLRPSNKFNPNQSKRREADAGAN